MTASVEVSARRTVGVGFLLVATLFLGFGGWAGLATISGAVVAPGQVEIERDRQIVQHAEGGVVSEILTHDSAVVKAGDVLIRLDGDLLRSERAIVESQYFELLASRGRIEAERDGRATIRFPDELLARAATDSGVAALAEGQRSLLDARMLSLEMERQQLARRGDQIASQIDGIDAQTSAAARQLDLILEEIADQEELLAKGLTQTSRVLALHREEARLKGAAGELKSSKAEAEGQRTEIGMELAKLDSRRREEAVTELRDLDVREMELAERRRALSGQIDRLDIRAPVGGIVQELTVKTPRSVIRPAEPILYIIPQDRPLLVVARVSPVHVDELHTGQEVALRFPAFDMRTTPELKGRLSAVSADTILDQRAMVSYYRAEVEIDAGEVSKLGGKTLVPGMPVEVFIKTGDRSPLSYMLQPFATYFNRAFRES